jgi:hypothetical protein
MFCVSATILAALRHYFLGPFLGDPEDFRNLSLGEIWNFFRIELPWYRIWFKEHM